MSAKGKRKESISKKNQYEKGNNSFEKKKINCNGDYCDILQSLNDPTDNRAQIFLFIEKTFSKYIYNLIHKMGITGTKVINTNDNQEGVDAPMNSKFQYRIMKQTIIRDRQNTNYLYQKLKQMKKINLNSIYDYLQEMASHKKSNEAQSQNQNVVQFNKKETEIKNSDLIACFERVPVCSVCYFIYEQQNYFLQNKRPKENDKIELLQISCDFEKYADQLQQHLFPQSVKENVKDKDQEKLSPIQKDYLRKKRMTQAFIKDQSDLQTDFKFKDKVMDMKQNVINTLQDKKIKNMFEQKRYKE